MGFEPTTLRNLVGPLTLAHHRVSSSSVVEHPTRSRRVVGSNPIWGSDFFRVYVSPRIYVISCCCYFSVRKHQVNKLYINYFPVLLSVRALLARLPKRNKGKVVSGSRVTLPENFACKPGLSFNPLARVTLAVGLPYLLVNRA